jgi:hypothetical protein
MYAGRGYNAAALPDEPCNDRVTLVASAASGLVGTMTIGFDSEQGLAVDEVFPDEVSSIRMAGRQVCEFTKLAVDGGVCSPQVLAAMFHVGFVHAHRIRGCDTLLIEVNPRHVRFYERKLGFRVLSAPRLNRRVGAPAVLLSLDLWHTDSLVSQIDGTSDAVEAARMLYSHLTPQGDDQVLGKWAAKGKVQVGVAAAAMS